MIQRWVGNKKNGIEVYIDKEENVLNNTGEE